ncbi:ABC transporter permease [Paenibacillus sp. P26]|nr:ABC transporter permease [Paenibacillus sp. P26]
MNLWESMILSIESLRSNKLRSFLTMIGIVVGVSAVVMIVSVGQAGKSSVVSDLAKYDKGFFVLFPDTSSGQPGEGVLDLSDLDEVRRFPGVKMSTGIASAVLDAKPEQSRAKEPKKLLVTGATHEVARLESVKMEAGRFYTAEEERARQKVIVIESDLATVLYGSPSQALGRKLSADSDYYRIIGVTKSEKSLFSTSSVKQYSAYMPLNLLVDLQEDGGGRLSAIYVLASDSDPAKLKPFMSELKTKIAKRHNAPVSSYFTQTGEAAQETVSSVFNVLQTIIGSIAGISLLVGGIGVMNIMLVSVTERTREIGIRKAVGATPGVIMNQFLVEAVFLCLFGGMIGTALGLLGAYIFSQFTQWPFFVSWGPWPWPSAFPQRSACSSAFIRQARRPGCSRSNRFAMSSFAMQCLSLLRKC